jgi:hypothetical protein
MRWGSVGKSTGMKFDDRGLQGRCSIDLAGVGIKKEAHQNVGMI